VGRESVQRSTGRRSGRRRLPRARCRRSPRQRRGRTRSRARALVYFPEFREFRPTTVYDRYALLPGAAFAGPAIVEERESSLVIGPGGRFEVAPSGNIIVAVG